MVDRLLEVTLLVEIDAENVHSECKRGSRQGGEVHNESESFYAKVGSPIVVLAHEPQMEIELPMDFVSERLCVEESQIDVGTLILFKPGTSENKGQSVDPSIGVDYHLK